MKRYFGFDWGFADASVAVPINPYLEPAYRRRLVLRNLLFRTRQLLRRQLGCRVGLHSSFRYDHFVFHDGRRQPWGLGLSAVDRRCGACHATLSTESAATWRRRERRAGRGADRR